MESYKSLVTVINKASSEFQEGKKWKCNEYCGRGGKPIKKPDTYPRSWKDFEQVMFAPPAKKTRDRRLTSRSRTTDESQSSMNRTGTQANKSRQDIFIILCYGRKQLYSRFTIENIIMGKSKVDLDRVTANFFSGSREVCSSDFSRNTHIFNPAKNKVINFFGWLIRFSYFKPPKIS